MPTSRTSWSANERRQVKPGAGDAAIWRVAILGIGDELLAGELVDTNSGWLARAVRARGHIVSGVALAGDEAPAIARAVLAAAADADLVVCTGGLGPTADDLTRDGLALAFGQPLEERADLVATLTATAARAGVALSEGNRQQARIPRGATALPNPRGTAPGILMRVARVLVAALPGVPSEMQGMAAALLAEHVPAGPALVTRRLLACGPSEAQLGAELKDLMHHAGAWRSDARLGINVSAGVLAIMIRGNEPAAVDAMEAAVRERLGAAIFGENEDTHAGAIVAQLAARGRSVTTAESCTGGLLAAAITAVPGSSAVFREGVVAYSYEAKTARLGVAAAELAAHGAVSEPVVRAMAAGARARAGADYALAISGIAGPDGGTADKPVGTVVLGLAFEGGERTVSRHWLGSRDEIRRRSVTTALEMLRRQLLSEGT
jgi:nicotinamide-nucleotide amidase